VREHRAGQAELQAAGVCLHFACTSEDINNTSHAMMIKAAREKVLLPSLDRVI
jgi:adenylosuccinate lyase